LVRLIPSSPDTINILCARLPSEKSLLKVQTNNPAVNTIGFSDAVHLKEPTFVLAELLFKTTDQTGIIIISPIQKLVITNGYRKSFNILYF